MAAGGGGSGLSRVKRLADLEVASESEPFLTGELESHCRKALLGGRRRATAAWDWVGLSARRSEYELAPYCPTVAAAAGGRWPRHLHCRQHNLGGPGAQEWDQE